MSANNQLVVCKIKDEYCVFYNGCVDNEFEIPETNKEALFKDKDKLKAVEFANDYCNEEMIEYGYTIIEVPKMNYHKRAFCLNCQKETEITYDDKCAECGEQNWD